MAYIEPKIDFKDGDVLHGIDLNASNEVIKAGVNDNFDRIQNLDVEKQDVIDSSNKLDYSLLDNTPDIPTKVSDLTNDTGFITSEYHDASKQDVLTAGTGISIENNVVSNTQTSAEWGNIQGDIEDQTDLMEAFSDKQDTLESGVNIKTINNQSILGSGNLSIGGGSGGTNDYDQLENRPQINDVTLTGNKSLSDLGINNPSKVSDLQNDAGYITASYHDSTKQDVIDSNNKLPYSNISGTPTIPTKISDLTNDNNTVTDANYVHTDNNFTTAEKTKLSGIESGAQVNVDEIVIGDESEATEDTKVVIDTTGTTDTLKYKDGNTFTELEIKALDSMPVGTEVDFNGQASDIPVGWEEVDDPNSYSTNEIKTNKTWIDNKPIYKKVLHLVNVARGYQEYAHNISNLGVVINVYGSIYLGNTYQYNPIFRVVPDNITGEAFGIVNITNTYIHTLAGTSFLTTNDAYVILEYTKTTD